MEAVSGMAFPSTAPSAAAAGRKDMPKAQQPEEEIQPRPLRPATDEYIHPEKPEPSGRYWPGTDENGRPKIYFDGQPPAADAPAPPADRTDGTPGADAPEQEEGAQGPERKDAEEERCTGSTDKVDREIEQLKNKKKELEQRINTESDEDKIKDLEQQLAQVERELQQKDTDTYRRQHTVFSS